MKKLILAVLLLPLLSLLTSPVFAHCPLCTAATGAAVATARFYGVSDLVSGSLVGVFIISTGLWVNNIIKKYRKSSHVLQMPLVLALSFVSTMATFYFAGMLHADKLFAGTAAGSLISLFAFWTHYEFRKFNNSKNYVPMQGLVLPLVFIAALNIMFYLGDLL